MDDALIIELYYKRDELAITETTQKYGTFCHRIAMNILSIREDAEECENDTYLTAWKRMPPALPHSLKAFLGKITRDLSISRYRLNHAKKRYSGMDVLLSELDECIPSSQNVEVTIESNELSEIISNWLDSLSPDDCALFVRRYWFGDSVQNLSKTYGCTPNQMAQIMLRLRRSLKTTLESEGVTI